MIIQEIATARRIAIQLRTCRQLLAGHYNPQGVRLWLTTVNPAAGRHSPLEMILDGFGDLVVEEAERLVGL